MIVFLILVGALFFVSGMIFGLISVFQASKFQYYLFNERKDIFQRIAIRDERNAAEDSNAISSRSIWNYIKSEDDNQVVEVAGYKNRIKKSFLLFSISWFIGLASILAAVVLMLFS